MVLFITAKKIRSTKKENYDYNLPDSIYTRNDVIYDYLEFWNFTELLS